MYFRHFEQSLQLIATKLNTRAMQIDGSENCPFLFE